MIRQPLLCILFFFILQEVPCQQVDYTTALPKKNKITKGWLYGSFGWHRIYYTKSTIRFRNTTSANYDFRLLRAKAIDDNDLRVGEGIDAPQWSLRFGGIVNKKIFNNKFQWGIEWNYDHAKYILKQGQRVRMKGQIGGYQYDQDTTINKQFIEYEHTDGANYYMLNFLLKRNLRKDEIRKHDFDLILKAGAGVVIPRTDSKIMGNHYNQHYHLAGYLMGIESSLRYELIKNIFAEFSVKGVYANYRDVLLHGDGRARQDWLSGQYLFTFSYQLPISKKIF